MEHCSDDLSEQSNLKFLFFLKFRNFNDYVEMETAELKAENFEGKNTEAMMPVLAFGIEETVQKYLKR